VISSLKAWLQLVRLPAVFSAWSNTIAAHAIAFSGAMQWSLLGIQLIMSTCFFWGGMILNDWFDYAEDARERPFRPLPSGRIARSSALIAAISLFVIGTILSFCVSIPAVIVSVVLMAMIVAYDASKKQGNIAAIMMGSCRYLHWLLGLSAAALVWVDFLIPLAVGTYIMAVTWLSQQETTAKDPRDLNRVMLGIGMAALLVGATGLLVETAWIFLIVGLFMSAGLIAIVNRLKADFTPATLQKGVMSLLIFAVLLDCALLLVNTQSWWALGLLALVFPGKWVGRWLYAS
jgi:4-hydroxybenzoate polyprenyltransferase|tara:strand:+ start:297 stop:1166 length:870 start_codon:yes stop_codon:yes gene_type:complete